MNAERIVQTLLDGEVSPEDFMKRLPKGTLMPSFEIVPYMGSYEVKRWENGSYYYIGKLTHDANGWYADYVAPTGRNGGNYIQGAQPRKTKEEAARDLWNCYARFMNMG